MPNLLNQKQELIYKEEAYKIIGAAMAVHREFGCGFLEKAYQEALGLEFLIRNIPFQREVPLIINDKGAPLKTAYIADFICFDKIILELKATKELDSIHVAQIFNYLKATGNKLGLLINFGETSLVYKRIVKET